MPAHLFPERNPALAFQRTTPTLSAMGLLRRIANEAKTPGPFKALTEGAVLYEEINGLMGK
jgi:hypothetical protein